MAKISQNWGYALTIVLDDLGYGSSKNLADAVGRTPPTVQRWKDGQVPPTELWPAIDTFIGMDGWTEIVVHLAADLDDLDKLGPSTERDQARELLGQYLTINPSSRRPLPASDRDRLLALEQGQEQQQAMIAGLQELVDSLLRELRGER